MNFIIKTQHWRVGKVPIHRSKLGSLLYLFGIPPIKTKRGEIYQIGHKHKRNLWELWDLVKARWKQLRRELHPDVAHIGHESFAIMSATHDAIIIRLKRMGIGPT